MFGDASILVKPSRVEVPAQEASLVLRGGMVHQRLQHWVQEDGRVLLEESKFVCNVTVFRSTYPKWRGLEPDLKGQGQRAFQWPGVFFRGFFLCVQGSSTRVVGGLLLHEEDLGSLQLFQVGVTVCH